MLFVAPYAHLVSFKVYLATERSLVFVEREKEKNVCSQYLIFLFCQVEQTRKYTFSSFLTDQRLVGASITHLFSRLLHAWLIL